MTKNENQKSRSESVTKQEVMVSFGDFGELSRHEISTLYREIAAPLEHKQFAQ